MEVIRSRGLEVKKSGWFDDTMILVDTCSVLSNGLMDHTE